MTKELWYLKHRPHALDQYVWCDPEMRRTIEDWLAEKALPHCLFSGHPGCGKSSLALLLLELLGIPDEDTLRINASRERRIDDLQDKIVNFIDAWAFNPTGLKYIFLDESDKLSTHAQGMLRGEFDFYPNCRFIMTCNEPRKIIEPLKSRLQEIRFTTLDRVEFVMRAADVMIQEQVAYDVDILMAYVNRLYPDLRKLLSALQMNSRDQVLQPIQDTVEGTHDYLVTVAELFKKGQYLEARKLLITKADPDNYLDIFRQFYRNLPWFGSTEVQQDKALVAIRDAMLNHSVVADQEINIAALLAELALIGRASS